MAEVDWETPLKIQNPEKFPCHIASHEGPGKDADVSPKPDFAPMRRKLNLRIVQSD